MCSGCLIEHPIEDFSIRNKKTGTRHSMCKQYLRDYAKKYRTENKELVRENQQDWYAKTGKDWKKTYEKENKEYIKERDRARYKTDEQYRMKKILRSRFKKTMKKQKKYKSILGYLGMQLEDFLKWIEFQFDDDMSWNNQGIYWEIDHVIPCSYYNLLDKEDVKKCFHWTNMRPLSKVDNNTKSNKIDKTVIEEHNVLISIYTSSPSLVPRLVLKD